MALAKESPSCSALLSAEQTEALKNAQQDDYEIAVLQAPIRGEQRTVVLLGEKHVKDQAAKLAGQDVVRLFPMRGLEGIYIDSTWGGHFFKWTIHAATFLSKVLTFGVRQHDSTIDDAIRFDRLHKAARRLSDRNLNLVKVEVEEREMSAHEVVQELGLNNLKEIENLPTPKNLPLELGHKPGLAENLQSVLLPTQLLTCGVGFCADTFGYIEPGNALSSELSPIVFTVAAITAAQTLAAKYLRDGFGHQKWYQVVFAIPNGLIHGRDQTMASNIVQALNSYPEHSQMLVIVGANHVRGIKTLLSESSGFQEVPLP